LIIDEFYEVKKGQFNKKYHQRRAEELCNEQFENACMDVYACLAVWSRIYLIRVS
jgi:hypothetical protein